MTSSDNGMTMAMNPADDDDQPPEAEDEEVVRQRVWYCVDQPDDIRQLAEWIKYKGETAIYWQEFAKHPQQRPLTPMSSLPASPGPVSPSKRHLLQSVSVPSPSKKKHSGKERRLVNKDDFMPLVDKIKKIAAFMEVARQ